MHRRYPFLPRPLQGGAFMMWLKRLHGWIGMWGALVGLLIGITGITLNHRAAIGASDANKVDRFQIQAPAAGFANRDALEAYVAETLAVQSRPVEAGPGGRRALVAEPGALSLRYQSASERYEVAYLPGNRYISVAKTTSGTLSTLNALHLGTRSGIVWVLVLDAFAGSLIFLAITGILLWSRMHGPALLAIGLMLSFGAGAFYFATLL